MSRTLPPRFTEVFSKPASSLSSEPEFAAGRPRPAGTCGDSDGPDGGHGLFVGRSLAQSERSRPGRAVRVSRPADRLSRPTRMGRLPVCPSLPVAPSESRLLGGWHAYPDHLGPARALALRTRRIPCPYASGHTGSLAAAAHWHITRKTLLEPQAYDEPEPGHWDAGSGHRYISDSDIVESLTS